MIEERASERASGSRGAVGSRADGRQAHPLTPRPSTYTVEPEGQGHLASAREGSEAHAYLEAGRAGGQGARGLRQA
eukprot:3705187-Pyramimonas_sp.AAC.1